MQVQIKMSYKTQKLFKKLYGKNLAREIAIGRNLLKNFHQFNIANKESK